MSEEEWYMYLLSITKYDIHNYWVVTAIEETTVEFWDVRSIMENRMKGTKLLDMLIENINCTKIKQNEGSCVIDYIWNVIKGKSRFLKYSYDKLKDEIVNCCLKRNPLWKIEDGISTNNIINWRDAYHDNISIYALDPF